MKRRRELADLEPCPRCGKFGGERKQSVNITGKYYVRCRCCGYTTSSNGEPNNAVAIWNRQSRKGGIP